MTRLDPARAYRMIERRRAAHLRWLNKRGIYIAAPGSPVPSCRPAWSAIGHFTEEAA